MAMVCGLVQAAMNGQEDGQPLRLATRHTRLERVRRYATVRGLPTTTPVHPLNEVAKSIPAHEPITS